MEALNWDSEAVYQWLDSIHVRDSDDITLLRRKLKEIQCNGKILLFLTYSDLLSFGISPESSCIIDNNIIKLRNSQHISISAIASAFPPIDSALPTHFPAYPKNTNISTSIPHIQTLLDAWEITMPKIHSHSQLLHLLENSDDGSPSKKSNSKYYYSPLSSLRVSPARMTDFINNNSTSPTPHCPSPLRQPHMPNNRVIASESSQRLLTPPTSSPCPSPKQ